MGSWFGLYYRHVHFRDERWLKLTALYWDRVYRFYSEDVESSLPGVGYTELGLMADGFVRHAVPGPGDVQKAAARFSDALDRADLSAYGLPEADQLGPFELRETLATWKAPTALVERLIDMELAGVIDGADGWLRMHTSLAHAYLLLLGAQVAPQYGAAPLADDEFDHTAAGLGARRLLSGVLERPPPMAGADEHAALLAGLSVSAVLPRDLDRLSVQEIIDFRHRYAGERARFRDGVTALLAETAELGAVRDRRVLLDHMQVRFDTCVRPALRDLERAMRGLRMDTAWGAINVQAAAPPAVASALAMLALHPSAPQAAAIGLGGFAFGVWTTALQGRTRRDEALAASPMAYLHHLRTGLGPLGLAERVRTAAARFAPPCRRPPLG